MHAWAKSKGECIENCGKGFGSRGYRRDLAQLANLFIQTANRGVGDIAWIFVHHMIHSRINLPRREKDQIRPGDKDCEPNRNERTSRGRARMIVRVVMSRATRVPCMSLSLSICESEGRASAATSTNAVIESSHLIPATNHVARPARSLDND